MNNRTYGKRKRAPVDGFQKRAFKPPRQVARQTVQAMVAQAIKRVTETKFFDVTLGALTTVTTGAFVADFTPSEGATELDRIGSNVQIMGMGYRIVATQLAAATTSGTIRVIMFVDSQANQAQPAVIDILQTGSVTAFRSMQNTKRFKILSDKTFTVGPTAGVSGTIVPNQEYLYEYSNIDMPAQFGSTGNSAKTNAPGLLIIGSNTAIDYTGTVRFKFKDL